MFLFDAPDKRAKLFQSLIESLTALHREKTLPVIRLLVRFLPSPVDVSASKKNN